LKFAGNLKIFQTFLIKNKIWFSFFNGFSFNSWGFLVYDLFLLSIPRSQWYEFSIMICICALLGITLENYLEKFLNRFFRENAKIWFCVKFALHSFLMLYILFGLLFCYTIYGLFSGIKRGNNTPFQFCFLYKYRIVSR